jgi:uncharacterized protein YicC (UPF0701 family)
VTLNDVDVMLDYRRRLHDATDRVDRLRILSDAPLFSFWHDVREEVKKAADEIEALRARVRALEGEDA